MARPTSSWCGAVGIISRTTSADAAATAPGARLAMRSVNPVAVIGGTMNGIWKIFSRYSIGIESRYGSGPSRRRSPNFL